MLNVFHMINNWEPPELSESDLVELYKSIPESYDEYLIIFQTEPYIDSVYMHCDSYASENQIYTKRFTFKENYYWNYDDELFFVERCMNNPRCGCSYADIEKIFYYYSEKYPDWKLNRYYTKPFRLLDHIYHCMRKDSAKEILYKAGLDELAANAQEIDKIDLLASKPSEIFDGISIKTLRALNCKAGAALLGKKYNRAFIKTLQSKFPNIFKEKLNDAQCNYLHHLIVGEVTYGEAGRLYEARRKNLMMFWNDDQYKLFLLKEKSKEQMLDTLRRLSEIDRIYNKYFTEELEKLTAGDPRLAQLKSYLLVNRQDYDKKFRTSNRMRDESWQERGKGYVVRYPQTINDFCREAIYMSNCLLAYVDAVVKNETTILFVRKEDDVNKPFITMEVFAGELMQAYHRFNKDCTKEEADWIKDYCKRHEIGTNKFKFDHTVDVLY